MTESEEFNENAIKVFKESQEGRESKIICIVTIGGDGKSRIFQSSRITPKQLSEILFQIANQMISRIRNIKQQKPN